MMSKSSNKKLESLIISGRIMRQNIKSGTETGKGVSNKISNVF